MDCTTIANNLRRLRLTRGITQDDLAERIRISVAAYRNYESGKSVPKVNILLAIANELGANLESIVSEPRTLTTVRFRATKRLSTREQILVDAANWLDNYTEVEELLQKPTHWKLADLVGSGSPQELAAKVRERAKINNQPIRDICGLLEDKCGVKVLSRPVSSEYFFGLSIGEDDGGPAIVVNTWSRISVERWIFSAAHELGHILLHSQSFKVDQEKEDPFEEREANQFASYFLMPPQTFDDEWRNCYGLPLLDRVFKVKRMFRVSYATVLYRLYEKGQKNIWSEFRFLYSKRYNRQLTKTYEPDALGPEAYVVDRVAEEPKHLEDVDFAEDRLSRLVRESLEKGVITRDRASEILALSPEDMMDRIEEWVA